MRLKLFFVLLTLTALLATAPVSATDQLTNEFSLVLVSAPEGGGIEVNDDAISFLLPGRYVLNVLAGDPDQAAASDDLIEVEVTLPADVSAPISTTFSLALVEGPADGALEVEGAKVTFAVTGAYLLRVTFTDENTVSVLDDEFRVVVKSAQQVEDELGAVTALLPELQAPVENALVTTALLPMVMQHTHAGDDGQPDTRVLDAVAPPEQFGAFNNKSIPVEMQAWWAPAYGHIHFAALMPLGQTVSGKLTIPVRIVMHNNPSVLKYLSIHAESNPVLRVPLGDLRCKQAQCAWGLNITLDTTKLKSGWRELRLRAEATTPDGKKFFNSSGIPVNVQNGGSVSNYNRFCNNTSLIGRGWYDGFDYTNAIIECVPTAPVKGLVKFRVRAQNASGHLNVVLDKSHFIPAVGIWPAQPDRLGVTLFDKAGKYDKWMTLSIDTKQLADGWHSLAVTSTGPKGDVSRCDGCPPGTNLPAGVAKMWFFVDN